MDSLKFEQWIEVELPRVFAFFSDPQNLPRLMPKHLDARVESVQLVPPGDHAAPRNAAGAGTVITFSFRPVPFLPIRQKWVAEIVEYKYLSYFRDFQRSGPMKLWDHRHEFESSTVEGRRGTIVRDRMTFDLGLWILGRLVGTIFLKRSLRKTFETRQQRLAEFFGS